MRDPNEDDYIRSIEIRLQTKDASVIAVDDFVSGAADHKEIVATGKRLLRTAFGEAEDRGLM